MFLVKDGKIAVNEEELIEELGKLQVDEKVPFHNLDDLAIALSLMNTHRLPGTENQQKGTYTSARCVDTLILLLNIFNGKNFSDVQTEDQGKQFAIDHRDLLQKMYEESCAYKTTDPLKICDIKKAEVTKIISAANIPELEFPTTGKKWSKLTEEEQRLHRRRYYDVMLEYYTEWNPDGYGATILRREIEKMEDEDKKPAAIFISPPVASSKKRSKSTGVKPYKKQRTLESFWKQSSSTSPSEPSGPSGTSPSTTSVPSPSGPSALSSPSSSPSASNSPSATSPSGSSEPVPAADFWIGETVRVYPDFL